MHASRYKFGIRALLLLTAITALAAWDLRRQEAFERAIARFDEVFLGSFKTLEEPTGIRRFQSILAKWLGLNVSNRTIKSLEIFPSDPTEVHVLSSQQIQLLRDLPPAQHVLLNNFEFSLAETKFRLRTDVENSLYLGGCRFRHSSLMDLRIPELTNLNLESCVDIEGLDSIDKAFPNLRAFTFGYGTPPKNLPDSLRGCRQLESLSVSGPLIKGHTLKGIEVLSGLKSLSVWDSAVSDASFPDIEKLARLKFVQLWITRVSDSTVAQLAKIPNLKRLTLSGSNEITDKGIACLKGMSLEELRIDGYPDMPRITDQSADALGSLIHLKELWIHGTHIGRSTIQQIARNRKLKCIILNSDQFHLDDVLPLASNDNIKIHCKNRVLPGHHREEGMTLTTKELRLLAGLDTSQDSSIELRWIQGVKGTHLQSYAHDVERVNLQGCNLEPDALEELSQRVEIRELDLSESNVDPAMLAPLIKLQKLEKLNLSNCSKIDDRIAPLIHALPALVRLDRHNTRLSADVSKQIQQQLNATARKQWP